VLVVGAGSVWGACRSWRAARVGVSGGISQSDDGDGDGDGQDTVSELEGGREGGREGADSALV